MRVDPNYMNTLTAAMDQSSSLEDKLTSELSSGLRVATLQDDPVAVAQAAGFAGAIAKDDTYVQTAASVTSKMQVADSTLGEVVTQLTTALSLAVKGNNGTLNAANRAAVAQQLAGLRDQVLSLANTSYLGEYLFGGSQGGTQPFTLDTSTTPATTVYNGDTKVQSIETPSGQKIQTNMPGVNLFGGATGAFAALNQLVEDVSSGAGSNVLTAHTSALRDALDQVSSQRSILDTSLSMVQATGTYFQTQSAQLMAQASSLVAADPAEVATQLSSAETQHRALLSVISAVGKNNLFDYLQ